MLAKRRKLLSLLMALALCLTLLPTAALAEGTDGASCSCTVLCTPEQADTACPVCAAEGADLSQCEGAQAQDGKYGLSEEAKEVQSLIDALPTVEGLAGMSQDEQSAVYDGLQTTYDAYCELPAVEQSQLTGAEAFEALFVFFSGMVSLLEDEPVAGILDEVYLDGVNGNDSYDGSQTAVEEDAAKGPVKTFAKARELLAKDGTIYISSTVTICDSETWELDTATYGSAIVKRASTFDENMVLAPTGTTLSLKNITLDGGSRNLGSTATVATIVKVENATLNLESGAVLQNNYNTRSGGAVHASNKSAVNMKDGSLIQNCGTWTDLFVGGGVALYNSEMTMTGGTITNCRANKGGGVSVIASTMTMSGGEISDNTLYDYGIKNTTGLPNPNFTVTTNAFGCGVFVSNGIAGGTSTKYNAYKGAQAYNGDIVDFQEGGSKFNLSGSAKIKNNGITDFAAANNTYSSQPIGGGICAIPHDYIDYFDADYSSNTEDLEINISGGEISGNGAAWGGGIACMFSPAELTMTGGTIKDNQAYKYGGGIYIATRNTTSSSRFNNTISGGTISGNHAGGLYTTGTENGNSVMKRYSAETYGGGICLDGWTNGSSFSGGATLTVSGDAVIDGNMANFGGGIGARLNSRVYVQGGKIINNEAAWWMAEEKGFGSNATAKRNNGGGIYSDGNLYIYGGEISGNTANNQLITKANHTATYSNGVWSGAFVYLKGSPVFGEDDDIAFWGSSDSSGNYYIYVSGAYTPGETPVSVTSCHYYTSISGSHYSARGVEIISNEYENGYQTGTILVGYSAAAGGEDAAIAAAAAGNFVPSEAMQDASEQSTYTSRPENSKPVVIGHSKLWNSSGSYIYLTYKQGVTVTYRANEDQGGSGDDVVKTYESGTSPAALGNDTTNFSNEGQTFTGWNTVAQPTAENEGTAYTEGTSIENLTDELVLYAQWEETTKTFTLTYETNGGSNVVDQNGNEVTDSSGSNNKEAYMENDIAKLFERTTTKEDYRFTGWYADQDLDQYIENQELEIEADTTVYAGWGFQFTFDPNGGTMEKPAGNNVTDNEDGTYSVLVTENKLVTAPDDPTRSGSYTFLGWNTKQDGKGAMWNFEKDTAKEPTTLYAQWKYTGGGGGGGGGTTYYTLSYESNGGTKYEDERYASGTTVELDKVPTREGYAFTGWYANEGLTEAITSIRMNGNKTVYAGWRAATVPDMLNGDDHFAYVIGYPDGTVRPTANISRAETAAIFFRLLKAEVRDGSLTSENSFEDVTEEMWCNKAISTIASLGIVKGRTASTFDPYAPITRAEFAAICARFDTGLTEGNSSFTDISGHWAEAEIERAASLGWVRGYTDGRFGPDDYITRAEAMTMINRVLCRIPEDESDLLPGMNVWPDNNPGDWYYLAVQEATDSHDFEHKGEVYETWTALTEDPDWTRYQD